MISGGIIRTSNLTNVPALLEQPGTWSTLTRRIGMSILTQKRCTKCGEAKPLGEFCKDKRNPGGRGARCKQCHNSYGVKHYKENIETERQRAAKRQREHYRNNPGSVINAVKKWLANNPDKRKEQTQRAYANNSESFKARARKRRMILKSASGEGITAQQARDVLSDRICVYCGKIATKPEIDHIVPVSMGGADSVENVALACRHCNRVKKNRSLLYFLYELLQ